MSSCLVFWSLVFNKEIAEFIAHVSLPLSYTGGLLTYIEIFYPRTADRLENFIDRLGEGIDLFVANFSRNQLIGLVFSALFSLFFFVIEPIRLGVFYQLDLNGYYLIKYLIILLGTSLSGVFIIFTVIVLSGRFIALLNKMTHGKALGSIGLFLTLYGVTGETYCYIVEFIIE